MDRSTPPPSSSSPYDSPNPHRLYRDPRNGVAGGVCAGIADYFGIRPILVRMAFVLGLFFFAPPLILGYVIGVLALPVRPPKLYSNPDEEAFWRGVSTKPDRTLAGLTQRFRDFEKRVGGLEAYVASKEFELNRAIRDLDR